MAPHAHCGYSYSWRRLPCVTSTVQFSSVHTTLLPTEHMVHIYAHSVLNACIADSQSQHYTVQWHSRGDRRVRADTIQTYATTRDEWLTLPTPHNCSSPYLHYTVPPYAASLKVYCTRPQYPSLSLCTCIFRGGTQATLTCLSPPTQAVQTTHQNTRPRHLPSCTSALFTHSRRVVLCSPSGRL